MAATILSFFMCFNITSGGVGAGDGGVGGQYLVNTALYLTSRDLGEHILRVYLFYDRPLASLGWRKREKEQVALLVLARGRLHEGAFFKQYSRIQ